MTTNTNNPIFLVGVGASAGGLNALTKLISNLPTQTGNFSLIVAQHLSPDFKSHLVEILQTHSKWKIRVAKNGEKINPENIYITPPDHNIFVHNKSILLKKAERKKQPIPSIDKLFESIADECGNCAIGVILSGTGTDGKVGAEIIKEAGGYVLVQQPEEAQHTGMPESVIRSRHYHKVLLAKNIGDEISSFIKTFNSAHEEKEKVSSLSLIFNLLAKKIGTDFSRYKPSTIGRRLDRRLETLSLKDTEQYYQHILKNPEELDELFQTMLIGVTGFFRDTQAFEELNRYLSQIIENKQSGDSIRIWSVGCATGEEPYSIAILLKELLANDGKELNIQIFATDIDEVALRKGRKGVFTQEQVKNISPLLLQKYFNPTLKGYEIKKNIRQMVLFSKHDITDDPPFVRLDLLSCRNLLIYFEHELQKEVVPIFHYALKEGGYLFLGKSENVSDLTDLFRKEDSKNKIFYRKKGSFNRMKYSKFRKMQLGTDEQQPKASPELSIKEMAEDTLIKTFESPYLIVDENLEVVYIKGKLQSYVDLEEGSINNHIFKIIHKSFHMEIRTLTAQAKKQNKAVKGAVVRFSDGKKEEFVRLNMKPLLHSKNSNRLFILIFEKIDENLRFPLKAQPTDAKDEEWNKLRIMELEQELSATKEHLHTFTEELETTNEELQSLNEELQSANEELKSSNEELETGNEELQSANEELNTANAELAHTNEELVRKENELLRIKQDLEMVQKKFQLALDNSNIILSHQNADLKYSWVYNPYTETTGKEYIGKNDLEINDLEKPVAFLMHELKNDVLKNGYEREEEIKINNRFYYVKIKPSFQNGEPNGIYAIGIDITDRKTATDIIVKNEATLSSIINEGADNIFAIDRNFNILTINKNLKRDFYERYGTELSTGDNLLIKMIGYPERQKSYKNIFERTFRGETFSQFSYLIKSVNPKAPDKFFDISFFPILDPDHNIIGGASFGKDVTHRVLLERQVQEITKRSANLTGDDFFNDLSDQLSRLFNMRYVYVGRYLGNEDAIQTMALRINGKLEKNFTYTLPHTPCAVVTDKNRNFFAENVQINFPQDDKLKVWNAQCYVGFPITSPNSGKSLGVLVMIDDEPWKQVPYTDYLLTLFSIRAGAELERMESDKRINEKNVQLDNIANNVPTVLFELREQSNNKIYFSYISALSESFFGISREEFQKNPAILENLMHNEDRRKYRTLWQKALKNKKPFEFDCRMYLGEAKNLRWIKINARATQDLKGQNVWFGFMEDITGLKNVESQLRQAKETAENAARAKEDFLSTMSHEIRTPLNAIIGLSNILLSKSPRDDQEKNLKTLLFSSENLMNLINDILYFNKMQGGHTEVEPANYNLRNMADSIYFAHLPAASQRNNALIFEIEENLPKWLKGDSTKLIQILNNLISNAIKFTNKGNIELTISEEKRDAANIYLNFSVADTGIGILEEKLNAIFEKFTQEDSSTVRKFGGTGLGLTITKSLLVMMDSEIKVVSEKGKGSTFSFTLKQEIGKEVESEISSDDNFRQTETNIPKDIKLLLVEDSPINRMVVQQYFEDWWHIQAEEAENGKEAVALASNKLYDLILMDIRMPEMNGYEATKTIRELNPAYKKVPIIALTADTTLEMNEVTENNLFTAVITKPFSPAALFQAITNLASMGNRNLNQEDKAGVDEKIKKAKKLEIPNFQNAEKTLHNKKEKIIKFYQLSLHSVEEFKKQIVTGVETRDFQMLSNTIHKHKMFCELMGLQKFYDRINRLRNNLKKDAAKEKIAAATDQVTQHFDELIEAINKRISELSF